MTSPERESAPTGLAGAVPGIAAVRTYKREWLRPDVVAGIVLAAILVPQGMAYAELAGLPAGHRALHHDRVPRRLRAHGPVARAGPRTGLVGVSVDLRGDRTARSCVRRPVEGDRARRDDGA